MKIDEPTIAALLGGQSPLQKLNERSRTILRRIVESYLATGEPVGSRNLSRALPMTLSPASIRNVMSDLEQLGLIISPHTSAGRLPTQLGLRLFVDGLLEVGDVSPEERRQIETQIAYRRDKSVDQLLAEASELISGLSHCAGVVVAEKQVARLRHIEFVPLEPGRGLVVLVDEDQNVENRIISLPEGLPPSALQEASNYLNTHVRGMTLTEAKAELVKSISAAKAELDHLTQKVIQAGLAEWSGVSDDRKSLIVRGQSNLLKDVTAAEDLERIRQLFDAFEAKQDIVELLGASRKRAGRAHLHRLREQAFLALRFIIDRRAVPG